MSILLIGVIFGLGFAYLATQNAALVALQLAGYSLSMPLYVVALGSLLIGLVVAWLMSAVDWASWSLRVQGRESVIRKQERELEELRAKVLELEKQNIQLRTPKQSEIRDEKVVISDRPRTIIERLKDSLST
jgi:uncharacterized integral membrane protein